MTNGGRSWMLGLLSAFLVLATAALSVAGNGHPVLGLVPALAAVVVVAIARLPLRWSAAGVLFLTLLAHNPGGRPMDGAWRGPLYGLGVLLYNNLRLIVGVGFLRFSALEVLLAGLGLVAALRLLGPDDIDGTKRLKAPLAVKVVLLVSFAAVVVLGLYGMARGGNFRQMLWQARQVGWLPIIAAIFIVAFRSQESYRMLGMAVIAAAVLRSLEGLYFYLTVMLPRHLEVLYILTHEDSVLFAVALTVLGGALLERPIRSVVLANLFVVPLVGWALVMNNRRLAYVSLAGILVVGAFIAGQRLRRTIRTVALVMAPLIITYVAIGWNSAARIFAPIASLRSVGDDTNASNETRDMENYNLVQTLLAHPVIGNGFGQPYDEVIKGPSVERFMENYRYIAHNSVLWLWSIGGLWGFTVLWLPITLIMFLVPRCYRAAARPVERIGVLAAMAATIAYVTQAYGDMGATGWTATMLLAAALALLATLAARRGAYPTPIQSANGGQ
jgi:hypothetical protein